MQVPSKGVMNPTEGFPIEIFQNIISHSSLAFLSPFSIYYDVKERKFVAHSKFYKKIFALFVHMCIFGYLYLDFQEWLQRKDQVQYWTRILSNTSFGLYLHSLGYTLWFKRMEILDFVKGE
ncbi:unnamed protein product, partial [Allacma fusca]